MAGKVSMPLVIGDHDDDVWLYFICIGLSNAAQSENQPE
jgi:hypothetical protein